MGWYDERFEEKHERVRYDCIACSRPMWFPTCKVGKYKTCSESCQQKTREAAKELRRRECKTCGLVFYPRTTQITAGAGEFCSQKCNTKSREALQSPESQAKARDGFRRRIKEAPFHLKGEKNPRWNGGAEATKIRNRERVRVYKKNNMDKVKVWCANRRKKTVGTLPPNIVQTLRVHQRNKCAICKCRLAKETHLDHIMPIAKGGKNEVGNVQLLCRGCNLSKAAKDPIAYMRSLGFLL